MQNGLRASAEGRGGSGAYLWAYVANYSEAVLLAEDWYEDQKAKGTYDRCSEPGMAVLFFEIDLEPLEVLNLNSTVHHETIRAGIQRSRGRTAVSQAIDDHVQGIAEHRLRQRIVLKLVEVQVPLPLATKARRDRASLTVGGDAYIIRQQGLSDLRVVDAKGVSLKRV